MFTWCKYQVHRTINGNDMATERKKSASKIKIQGNFPYKNIVCFLLSGWQNGQNSGKNPVKKWSKIRQKNGQTSGKNLAKNGQKMVTKKIH